MDSNVVDRRCRCNNSRDSSRVRIVSSVSWCHGMYRENQFPHFSNFPLLASWKSLVVVFIFVPLFFDGDSASTAPSSSSSSPEELVSRAGSRTRPLHRANFPEFKFGQNNNERKRESLFLFFFLYVFRVAIQSCQQSPKMWNPNTCHCGVWYSFLQRSEEFGLFAESVMYVSRVFFTSVKNVFSCLSLWRCI